jgi:polyferredoxin
VSTKNLIRLRRLCQVCFFLLFLFAPTWFLRADPLAAVLNALSTHSLYRGLLWSLLIIIPTIFLGRVFCGWACPLGTLNHWVGSWKSAAKRGPARIASNRYRNWHRTKDYILLAVLALAALGTAVGGLLDPISLLLRGLALSYSPALDAAGNGLLAALYASGAGWVRTLGDVLNFIFQRTFLHAPAPHFVQGMLLGVLLAAVLALNLRVTRFWCRALCPLGALLGWISRWSILGLEKHPSHCDDCQRCLLNCQGGDDPIPGARWRKSECHVCLNCVGDCPDSGLRFRFFPRREGVVEGPDLRRRGVFAALASGAALLPLARAVPAAAKPSERLVRPPGALEEKHFLERCIRCGNCMKVCPNNALHPAFLQAGFEGLWTPVLVARIGYCEPACVECGRACPTGAIWEFTEQQKGWSSGPASQPIRIGTAFYDHGRCLPWSMAKECIVCEEWCPTSPKAIYLRPAEVVDSEGRVVQLRQPYIDPSRCVGCGACEYACPVRDRPAVYVTSIGESRSQTNQFLLPAPLAAHAPEALLPASVEGQPWERGPRIRKFSAEQLWEYIDGAAERFLQAGVLYAYVGDYRYGGSVDAAVELYRMSSAAGAQRIFDSEPAAGSRSLPAGDAARLYDGSVTLRRGPWFVRITVFAPCPAQALVALAQALDGKLK